MTQHFPLQLVVSPVRSSKVSASLDFTHSAASLPESYSEGVDRYICDGDKIEFLLNLLMNDGSCVKTCVKKV